MGVSRCGPVFPIKAAHLICVHPGPSHPTTFLDLSINTAVCGTVVTNRAPAKGQWTKLHYMSLHVSE